MMRPFLLSYLICITLACGSDEEAILPNVDQGQYIKTGVSCGLCAGICMDTLIVTPTRLFYKGIRYGESTSTFLRNADYSPAEWESLVSLLEPDSLNGIVRESCARCVDGCDLWYDIEAGGVSNHLSVMWNDTLPGNLAFQQALDSLRAQFRD